MYCLITQHLLRLYTVGDEWMDMTHGWNDSDWEIRSTGRTNCPSVIVHRKPLQVNFSARSYIYHRTSHTFHITWQQNSYRRLWLFVANPVNGAAALNSKGGKNIVWQPAEGFLYPNFFTDVNITLKQTEASFSCLLTFVLVHKCPLQIE
jgi:hypothetical protein